MQSLAKVVMRTFALVRVINPQYNIVFEKMRKMLRFIERKTCNCIIY